MRQLTESEESPYRTFARIVVVFPWNTTFGGFLLVMERSSAAGGSQRAEANTSGAPNRILVVQLCPGANEAKFFEAHERKSFWRNGWAQELHRSRQPKCSGCGWLAPRHQIGPGEVTAVQRGLIQRHAIRERRRRIDLAS